MENYIGMAAVFAAIVLSRKNKSVPIVILAYYVMYMMAWEEFIGYGSAYAKITMSKNDAAAWYLIYSAISTLIVISLLAFCKRTTIVKFYAAIVALSALYNTFGLFFSSLSMDWYSDIYLLHQRYAIQLDIVIAWLASDNVISRNINGAFKLWRKEIRS